MYDVPQKPFNSNQINGLYVLIPSHSLDRVLEKGIAIGSGLAFRAAMSLSSVPIPDHLCLVHVNASEIFDSHFLKLHDNHYVAISGIQSRYLQHVML